jgi:hypothetical protein
MIQQSMRRTISSKWTLHSRLTRHVRRFASVSTAAGIRDLKEDENRVVLHNPKTDKYIVMVGTIHIVEDSAKLVEDTVKTVCPDIVMVELDAGRVPLDELEEAKIQVIHPKSVESNPPSKQTSGSSSSGSMVIYLYEFLSKVKRTLLSRVQFILDKMFFRAIKNFYKDMESHGHEGGREFIVAIKEAKKLNAKVLLGDDAFGNMKQDAVRAIMRSRIRG